MKYGKHDLGIYVSGDSLYTPSEQAYYVIQFARQEGFDVPAPDMKNIDKWSYDDMEDFGMLLEDAVYYLNTNCTEDGYAFAFIDTDFRLIGGGQYE